MKRQLITIIAISAAFMLLLAGCAPAVAPVVNPETGASANTVTVSGTGSITIVPDVVTIQLGVITRNPNAGIAISENADTMGKVVEALKASVKAENITTAQLSVNPTYNYQSPTPVIEGYEVNNAVVVRIEDVDKAGAIVDAGLAAGANSVNGITFGVKDNSAAYDKALQAAMQDAKRKADVLAKAGGATVGGVVRIVENGSSYVPYPAGGMRSEAAVMDIGKTIQSGSLEVSASIQVEYAIK